MERKQLVALFICNFAPFITGNILLPLLPVYMARLGIETGAIGIYFAFAFAALAGGSLLCGWISSRFQKRRLTIIIAAAISIPSTLLIGQMDTFLLITLLTMITWAMGGLVTGMVNILTGLSADPAHRGQVFGTIGLAVGLGQVIGGLGAGPVVDRWGFSAMFIVASLPWIMPLVAALFIDDKVVVREHNALQQPLQLTRGFWLLLLATLLSSTIASGNGLARPLAMDALDFNATALSSTAAVSGIIALPLPFIIGWASDRLGRKRALAFSYLCVGLGTLVLVFSSALWHFWLSTILITANIASMGAGSALVADLVPAQSLDRALSRFVATPWVAGVIGFGVMGYIVQALGLQITFLLAGIFPLISLLVLVTIKRQARPAPA